MPWMLVYDEAAAEIELLHSWLSRSPWAETTVLCSAQSLGKLKTMVDAMQTVSVHCSDYDHGGLPAIQLVKERFPEALTVVIADPAVPPTAYIRPDVLPSGLLLRPISAAMVEACLGSAMEHAWERAHLAEHAGQVLVVRAKDGVQRIPYDEILYFEAKNKRIAVCTRRMELEYYATLEGIEKEAPECFLRCHKGYIVNLTQVQKVDYTNHLLQLPGGIQLPISRSCRSRIKEALK